MVKVPLGASVNNYEQKGPLHPTACAGDVLSQPLK